MPQVHLPLIIGLMRDKLGEVKQRSRNIQTLLRRDYSHAILVTSLPAERLLCAHRITRETVASQTRNPQFAWSQKVRQVNYGGCYYFEPISVADVDAMDPAVACEHFNQVCCANGCG